MAEYYQLFLFIEFETLFFGGFQAGIMTAVFPVLKEQAYFAL